MQERLIYTIHQLNRDLSLVPLAVVTGSRVMQDLVCSYSKCPVCNSEERVQAHRRPYYDRYMKAMSDQLKLSYKELLRTFNTYECQQCKSICSDPWLNSKGMYALYGKGHSQHILGWEIFYDWVNAAANNNSNQKRAELWRKFEKIVGPINVFGQLNCPFFGPLLYFNDIEEEADSKIDRVAEAMSRVTSTYLHPYNSEQVQNRLMSFLGKRITSQKVVTDQYNIGNSNYIAKKEVKKLIRNNKSEKSNEHDLLKLPVYSIPQNRYLVFEPSSCFWSTNCNSLNCSCKSLSGELLNTPVIDLKDVKREKIHFDLFCIFNALDHYINPKEILSELLEHSKVVFFDTHQSDEERSFSRQHFYVFGKNFLQSIAEPDWSWVDVSDIADLKFQNSYMVSKTINLPEAINSLKLL